MADKSRGQGGVEYSLVFALSLIIMLIALIFILFWPNFLHSVEERRSADDWASARPFAVTSYGILPDKAVLEITNTEPVTLTLREVRVGGLSLDFNSHALPFSWGSSTPCCSGGSCSLALSPGETVVISTDEFGTEPVFPCNDDGGGFSEGKRYKVPLSLVYHGSDPLKLTVESSSEPLIGKCTRG